MVRMAIDFRPAFSIAQFELATLSLADYGLSQNPCIPDGLVNDKFFPLLTNDPAVVPRGLARLSYTYTNPPPASVLAQATTYNH